MAEMERELAFFQAAAKSSGSKEAPSPVVSRSAEPAESSRWPGRLVFCEPNWAGFRTQALVEHADEATMCTELNAQAAAISTSDPTQKMCSCRRSKQLMKHPASQKTHDPLQAAVADLDAQEVGVSSQL
ncbi:unnamed protein product [Effrenium voratum]|uniref:Uncharacterized protein n=1 Tax=Effrenium voratum TaxID=2562239 RepID=A0AA36ND51_9DINO|nr:unnamed protein product [Effrenium voratum]